MGKNCNEHLESHFYCTKCGKEGIPIQRPEGQRRKTGHLKRLYCIYCNEIVNHAEIRENSDYTYEDFKEEFTLGRFCNGEKEEIKDLLYCSNNNCEFNKNGRCWNSNYSNNCKHRGVDKDGG